MGKLWSIFKYIVPSHSLINLLSQLPGTLIRLTCNIFHHQGSIYEFLFGEEAQASVETGEGGRKAEIL